MATNNASPSSSSQQLPDHLDKLWAVIVQNMQTGQFGCAANDLQRLLKQAPYFAPGWNNLGVALRRMRLWEAAEACFRRGLALPGGSSEIAWSNYGNALRDNGRFHDAEQAFCNAIGCGDQGGTEGTRYNYSLLLRDMNQLDKALELIAPVIAANPGNGQYRWDYALMLLQTGHWEKGFQEYEHRWSLGGLKAPSTSKPVWNGENLDGKTLVVLSEQGMGDSIHFSRYIPRIPLGSGKLVMQVRKPLLRLFQNVQDLEHVVVLGEDHPLPRHDYHLPIGSLPGRVAARPDDIPAPLTFNIPAELIGHAAKIFPERAGRKRVGLIWAGSPGHRNDRNRSCRLQDFLPLLSGAQWDAYSFQIGSSVQELVSTGAGALCGDLSSVITDFLDTAAYFQHIDLLISVDTGPAHLAGALGVQTMLLLPEAVDWRWGIRQNRTPWYKSFTLVQQDKQGDWNSAFARLHALLAN